MIPLTVVTVVRDDNVAFCETKTSIADQTCGDFEWIVVDSSSPPIDLTEDERTRLVWVPPEGIFAAMNVGLSLARGQYVYYLNAGDVFASRNVVGDVISSLMRIQPLWAVGEVIFIDELGAEWAPTPLDFSHARSRFFADGRFPPHQGTFVQRTSLEAMGGFSRRYAVASDYEAALKMAQVSDPYMLATAIARFKTGGASTRHRWVALREFHMARRHVLRPSGLNRLYEWLLTAKSYVLLLLMRFRTLL